MRKSIKVSEINYKRLRDLQYRLRYRSVDKLLDDLLTIAERILEGKKRLPDLLDLSEG